MRNILTIIIITLSTIVFGQNESETKVLINSNATSLPEFIIKLGDDNYLIDSLPEINPDWIDKLEVVKIKSEQDLLGNKNGKVIIYPKKRYYKKIRVILEELPEEKIEKINRI